ncbi:MAG TPA: subclass B3 metallo-beta-lactamase [Steroidobacteraceae bacterium]|jgi:metallo-beta-lactamase class B
MRVLCIAASCLLAASWQVRAELRPEQAEKNRPVAPFRIIGNVYYVGASDVTAYLIRSSDGLILLDGGFAETAEQIQANVAILGFKVADIKLLLNGHAHPDHAGGLPAMKQASSAQLVALKEEVVPLEHNGRGTFYRGDRLLFADMKVDRTIVSGETVRLGDVKLMPHLTAGHTPGCTTWTMQTTDHGRTYNVAFVCQLTPPHGESLTHNANYPQIAADFARTFELLRKLPCDVFLAEHGTAFDLTDKLQRLTQGSATNPFIDPDGFRRHVAQSERDFKDALASEQAQRPAPQTR